MTIHKGQNVSTGHRYPYAPICQVPNSGPITLSILNRMDENTHAHKLTSWTMYPWSFNSVVQMPGHIRLILYYLKWCGYYEIVWYSFILYSVEFYSTVNMLTADVLIDKKCVYSMKCPNRICTYFILVKIIHQKTSI